MSTYKYDEGTDTRYELEDGILLEMPHGQDSHEAIITFLLLHLYREIRSRNLNWEVRPSGTGVRTKTKKSRLTDLIVMTPEQRQSIKGKSAVLEIPPLLVVEVVNTESVKREVCRIEDSIWRASRDYQKKHLNMLHSKFPNIGWLTQLKIK